MAVHAVSKAAERTASTERSSKSSRRPNGYAKCDTARPIHRSSSPLEPEIVSCCSCAGRSPAGTWLTVWAPIVTMSLAASLRSSSG